MQSQICFPYLPFTSCKAEKPLRRAKAWSGLPEHHQNRGVDLKKPIENYSTKCFLHYGGYEVETGVVLTTLTIDHRFDSVV
ncbi:hypothetical protein J6590_059626 [Homalodisca vitripennis]|nr:hypothetical protein J6590_059626 [Homalodisca vitripennis]